MSQPFRLAYISIVIAVHEASDTASISWGFGPRSLARAAPGERRVGEPAVRVGAVRRRLVVAVVDDAVEQRAGAVERARRRVRHGAVAVRGLERDLLRRRLP